MYSLPSFVFVRLGWNGSTDSGLCALRGVRREGKKGEKGRVGQI